MTARPEMMDMAINANPMMRQLLEQNPELGAMLRNPELIRSMMTPENIQMAMSMMQQMRGVPGMSPFGGMVPPSTGTPSTTAPTAPTGTGATANPYTAPPMSISTF